MQPQAPCICKGHENAQNGALREIPAGYIVGAKGWMKRTKVVLDACCLETDCLKKERASTAQRLLSKHCVRLMLVYSVLLQVTMNGVSTFTMKRKMRLSHLL